MTEINIKLLDITSASDGDVLKYVAANGSVEYGAAPGAASINTHTVTVSGGVFYIDSTSTPILSFEPGSTYKFDQSDASNASHPLRFSTVLDGTHNSGSEYTTNVTTSGTPGTSGAYTQIVISYSTPTLYYYCSNHSGMGNASIIGNPDSAANDYATYTTVTGLINTVQANVTALPDSAANDYSTYTTLSGLINTVQSNVTALPDSAANDYATYTTLSNLIDSAQATLNANDYATYTTVTGLINTVQSNLTSVIGAAPTTLDTLAEIAAALENDANIAVTLTNAIGTVSANAATNATNIDKVQANLSVLPDSAANDYSTYTTLSNLIDTVQDNVVATSNTTNTWVNSNDYSTYTTVTANLYNTYTSLLSDVNLVQGNVTSLTFTVDSADANLYNTYITVTGLIDTVQANVTSLPNSAANDYTTYTTVTGLIDTVQANVTTNATNINTIQSNLTAITSSDLDMGGNKVLFGNMYATEGDLPSATTYHGMFAHVHGTGKGYFAHAGAWIKLLDESSSTTSNLAEGVNLYYTDARVNTHLNVSTANANQVLSWSGSDYTWVDQSTGSSSIWSNVSSNVTAAAGDKLFVDTSANPITITLPASPAFGSEIRVIDIKGTSANNKITLDNNGNNIEGITDSLEVNINRAAFGLVFYDATEGWVFIEK